MEQKSSIEAEDHQIDRLLGTRNGVQERLDSFVWLNDEFHSQPQPLARRVTRRGLPLGYSKELAVS